MTQSPTTVEAAEIQQFLGVTEVSFLLKRSIATIKRWSEPGADGSEPRLKVAAYLGLKKARGFLPEVVDQLRRELEEEERQKLALAA